MQGKRLYAVVLILLICFAITVCDSQPDNNPVTLTLTYDEAVKKVTFTDDSAIVNFANLNNHDIYLVMVNSSDLSVPAASTGSVVRALSAIPPDHMTETKNYANLPPIDKARSTGLTADIVPYGIGSKKNFWVLKNYGGSVWESRQATLMASGVHGNIWIMDENIYAGKSESIISDVKAQELASQFDRIYPLATNLLGYEYGGGPNGNGGVDGDKKIQILVYDFYELYHWSEETTTAGSFLPKDFFTQEELTSWGWKDKTNLAEIFYLNANTVIASPDYAYSLLIHEFQHMINFNMKYVKHGENAATWYNEMLSTMAEDVIAPLIGIGHTSPGHPISMRIPRFLDSYSKYGITEWGLAGDSYAVLYAFGAYLVRNYGGPGLLKSILGNDKVNVDSLTLALKEFSRDMDFAQALNRYSEAMIFSGSSMPKGVVSFDRTVTSKVNGKEYTAYGFNIWQTFRRDTYDLGPLISDFGPASMRPNSVIIQSDSQWRNKSGYFSITLEKPANPNIELFLLAR